MRSLVCSFITFFMILLFLANVLLLDLVLA